MAATVYPRSAVVPGTPLCTIERWYARRNAARAATLLQANMGPTVFLMAAPQAGGVVAGFEFSMGNPGAEDLRPIAGARLVEYGLVHSPDEARSLLPGVTN